MTRFTSAALAACAVVLSVGAASAQESFTNLELSDMIVQNGKPYALSKLRNKTITVTGELERFVDTSVGSKVWAVMDIPNGHYAVRCEFPRKDQETYDRMAVLQPGAAVTFTGRVADIDDAFIEVTLQSCMPQ